MKIHKLSFHIFPTLLVICVCAGCSPRELCSNQMWMDLSKNTEAGYSVPYKIRYDNESWRCRTDPQYGAKIFNSKYGNVEVVIRSFKDAKNLSTDTVIDRFQQLAALELAESAEINFTPPETRLVNDISFIYNQASSAESSPHEIFEYTWSGDEGCITLLFKVDTALRDSEEERVSEFLRGFSLDGQACKGAAPLRFLKNVMETLEASDNPPTLDVEPGIHIRKGEWG